MGSTMGESTAEGLQEIGTIIEDGQVTQPSVEHSYQDEEEGQVHDQLPSVEEYKTNMAGATKVLASRSPVSPDDLASDDGNVHDLPTVDEYKAATGTVTRSASSSSSFRQICCWTLAGICFMCAILAAILMPMALKKSSSASTRLNPFSRRSRVVHLLTTFNISTLVELSKPETPQYKAALWIADHDAYQMAIPQTVPQFRRFTERYALAVFYYATGGPQWRYDANFLSPTDICDWNGVTVSRATGEPVTKGVTRCVEFDIVGDGNTELYARDIFLFANEMDGTLPNEIEQLQRLEILSLFGNPSITGELSAGILKLSHLQDLELHYCALSGTLPDLIGRLTALTNLGLSNNLLVGTIPDSLFDMTNLEWLFLDDNILHADISEFGWLTNLRGLYAEDAGLYGQLTSEMIDGWSKMEELDLSTNLISGKLPENIFGHPTMAIVDLHENRFDGTIPDVSSTNPVLKFLALYSNKLTGTIPPSIGSIENLGHLDLGINELNLPLPNELGDLTHLRYLFTNNNNFGEHDFPGFVEKLTNLRELSMKDNNIIGSIPSSISQLNKLVFVDLDRNKFQGSIPEEIASLTSLGFLFLNRNQLTGTLPSSMTSLSTLRAVLLDGNSLTGTADVICADTRVSVDYFSSDCRGPNPEFECSCCTVCCNDANVTCNNYEWTLNLDAIWEYGHSRRRWSVDWTLLSEDETDP